MIFEKRPQVSGGHQAHTSIKSSSSKRNSKWKGPEAVQHSVSLRMIKQARVTQQSEPERKWWETRTGANSGEGLWRSH